jgi:hypothetical protein
MMHHRSIGTTLRRSDRRDERSNPLCLPERESRLQRRLMRQRGRDEGASQCRSVMDRIKGESSTRMGRPRRSGRPTYRWRATSPGRENGLTSLWSSVTREPRLTDSGRTSRNVGSRNACWCGSRACARLALPQKEEGQAHGLSAPGAYREGRCNSGRAPRGAFVKA